MKRSELATLLLIAVGSVIIAYFIGNAVFGGIKNSSVTVQTIQTINSSFQTPDPTIFNSNAINPTVGITLTGTDSTSQ